MKNFLTKTLVALSWAWLAFVSVTYMYVMLFDEGIISTINNTHIDNSGTFVTVLSSVILLIKYPISNIAQKINDTYYSAIAKKRNKKEMVPIITLK